MRIRIGTIRPAGTIRARRMAALVLALAAASSACDRRGQATPPSQTTTPLTAATTTIEAAEQAVLDGYRAYWDAYLASADPMDPNNPALAMTATGRALETVQRSFLALRSAGKVIRGELDLAPRVVEVDGDAATVRDCYGDGTGVYDASTGERQDEPTGQRHLVNATLRLEGGNWKVERLEEEGLGCTAG